METLDIEKLQQELQKFGHERLDPNDPLFMDHLARRLELQWHYTKIQELLDRQQNKIEINQMEFSEALRKSYSEWINEGGKHLKKAVETAGNDLLEKINLNPAVSISETKSSVSNAYFVWLIAVISFSLGLLLAWKFL